ncbi:MAG: cyclopropane-fatty-acyl-phospholipid synthase family protein [Gemmatimonadota bacterium]|nr:cyclopropane-fatty-acyl-phospholipid synthase family protein [Gemmatimonadota bacterium]
MRLWDGTMEGPGHAPRFTLVLRRAGALRRMFLPPSEMALGEAYLRDDFDIEGDIGAAVGLGDVLAARLPSPRTTARLIARLRALPTHDTPFVDREARRFGRMHSRQRDAAAVRSHYDVGNDFFALWLDARMVYSCGYFATGAEDLDTAQVAKLEHICRKLRLKPGERLLDIGCGWGGLVHYAAERYGVEATGITLSEPQAAFARARIAAAGLGAQCRVEVRDYRDLPQGEAYDKVVSVGMFEHVGRATLPTYFDQAFRLTKPGGLFLNHGIVDLPGKPQGIARRAARTLWQPASFIERYVFPDSELIAPWETVRYAENAGFETRDVESLREHYARTLRHWVRRLEAHHAEAVRATNEQTYRVWRIYMAGCARAFADGRVGIIQTLLNKPEGRGGCRLPPTRDDLYQGTNGPVTIGAAS